MDLRDYLTSLQPRDEEQVEKKKVKKERKVSFMYAFLGSSLAFESRYEREKKRAPYFSSALMSRTPDLFSPPDDLTTYHCEIWMDREIAE